MPGFPCAGLCSSLFLQVHAELCRHFCVPYCIIHYRYSSLFTVAGPKSVISGCNLCKFPTNCCLPVFCVAILHRFRSACVGMDLGWFYRQCCYLHRFPLFYLPCLFLFRHLSRFFLRPVSHLQARHRGNLLLPHKLTCVKLQLYCSCIPYILLLLLLQIYTGFGIVVKFHRFIWHDMPNGAAQVLLYSAAGLSFFVVLCQMSGQGFLADHLKATISCSVRQNRSREFLFSSTCSLHLL